MEPSYYTKNNYTSENHGHTSRENIKSVIQGELVNTENLLEKQHVTQDLRGQKKKGND